MCKLKTLVVFLCAGFIGLAVSAQVKAADGATLYKEKTCIACHGPEGKTPVMSEYPKVAGQNEAYLLNQMKDIKNGSRNHDHTPAMKNVMHRVSDEEMVIIAKWLAGL